MLHWLSITAALTLSKTIIWTYPLEKRNRPRPIKQRASALPPNYNGMGFGPVRSLTMPRSLASSRFSMRFSANYSTDFCIRVFGITRGWKAMALKAMVWVDMVTEVGRRFMTAWRKEEVDAPRNREEKRKAGKIINRTRVCTTLLLWFVNRGSRDDLRKAPGSRDVPISPDEVGSRKGSERERSEQGGVVRRPRPPCSTIPLYHPALPSRSRPSISIIVGFSIGTIHLTSIACIISSRGPVRSLSCSP